jgi:hypothetical protein
MVGNFVAENFRIFSGPNMLTLHPFRKQPLNSCAFMSTFRPRNRTPSASGATAANRGIPSQLDLSARSKYALPGQTKSRRHTRATIRAAPGYPTIFVTAQYVDSFPRGIARIVCSIRSSIVPVLLNSVVDLLMPEHSEARCAN